MLSSSMLRVGSPLVLVPLLALAGCASGPVELATPPGEYAEACEALAAALPDDMNGQKAVESTPAGAGKAWGDPAITVDCATTMPESFTEGASCEEANGVGWYVPMDQFADTREDLAIYTIGREPIVRLSVPADYRLEGAFVADAFATVADAVKANTKLVAPCI